MKEVLKLIEPTELFNLLNQTLHGKPCIADECYMLLFDARKSNEFSESHIITARHVPYEDLGGYIFPKKVDFSSIRYIVVIDNRASSLKEVSSPAVTCGNILWKMGSKNPVNIVKGGYEDFSALYPFLRSQKILFTQHELLKMKMYPVEIEPGFLYIGSTQHSFDQLTHKHLRIKAHINVTTKQDQKFTEKDIIIVNNKESIPQLLNIPIEDDVNVDIYQYFATACLFLGQHQKKDGKSVLLYSDLGSSRCVTIALSFLIIKEKISLKEAVKKVISCHHYICPNRSFMKSLLKWEKEILGEEFTKPEDFSYLSYE